MSKEVVYKTYPKTGWLPDDVKISDNTLKRMVLKEVSLVPIDDSRQPIPFDIGFSMTDNHDFVVLKDENDKEYGRFEMNAFFDKIMEELTPDTLSFSDLPCIVKIVEQAVALKAEEILEERSILCYGLSIKGCGVIYSGGTPISVAGTLKVNSDDEVTLGHVIKSYDLKNIVSCSTVFFTQNGSSILVEWSEDKEEFSGTPKSSKDDFLAYSGKANLSVETGESLPYLEKELWYDGTNNEQFFDDANDFIDGYSTTKNEMNFDDIDLL